MRISTRLRQLSKHLYSVKVADVRTMNRRGKPRRTKLRMMHTSAWKRAVVVLVENSTIDLFYVSGQLRFSC